MENTLTNRTIKSSTYILGGYVLSQLFRLSSNLILTRLLIPEMFGVMAIVTVFMMGIRMLTDIGLQQNVVQSKRGSDRQYLNTAWTIQIVKGGIIFLIALLISITFTYLSEYNILPKNTVYSAPELPYLILLVSLTALVGGFTSINLFFLNRKLLVGKGVIIELVSQFIGLTFTIIAAWYYREIWTLVVGTIISSIIKMFLSHHKSLGEKCSFTWDKDSVYEIYHFGKWIFISSIMAFLLSQGDRLLLGLWETPELIGVYSIAFFLSSALKEAIKKIIYYVFYTALSEVARERPDELSRIYYKIRNRVDLMMMTASGILVATGHIIIEFMYDERYHDAGWMFEILSLSNIFVGFSLAGACMMAKGDAKSNTILTMVATIFLFISTPIAYIYFGLYGAVLVISLNYISAIPASFIMMKKHGLLNIKNEFKMIPVFLVCFLITKYLMLYVF